MHALNTRGVDRLNRRCNLQGILKLQGVVRDREPALRERKAWKYQGPPVPGRDFFGVDERDVDAAGEDRGFRLRMR